MTQDQFENLDERLKALELSVGGLVSQMDRAVGAWLFIKLLGAFAIGTATLWALVADRIFSK